MGDALRWLVFGAGAIGTYIGGSIALFTQGGKNKDTVCFVERPEVAAQVRQRGLHISLSSQEHILPDPAIFGDLGGALEHGPFDIAIFATKSYDTQNALSGMAPYASRLPAFLCLQNGVENEAALGEVLGKERVIAGTVTSAIGRRSAGEVVLERLRGIGVAGGHPLSELICRTLTEAGLNARLYPRAGDMKWSKLLTNLLANATSAILDMAPGEVFSHPTAYKIEVLAQREALRTMQALGYRVVDLPGTPVRLLAAGMRYLPLAISRPLLKRFAGKGRGEKMPSFHIDLHSGRGLSEVDYLNGAVVRFGQHAGIATPANAILTRTLIELTNGQISLQTYRKQPERLLKEIHKQQL